jgi:hypothetical protein
MHLKINLKLNAPQRAWPGVAMRTAAFLLLAWARAQPPPPIAGFAPPASDTLATGGDLGASFSVADAPACAAACLANASCVAFTLLPPLALKTCGIIGECYAPNASSCPATLALACPGGVFTSVLFAQYGLPTCGAGECAFTTNASSCNAPTSADVVASACVGKDRCAIAVDVRTFGADPCPGVYKFLAASLAGTGCGSAPPGGPTCQLSQYSRTFAVASAGGGGGTYYQRLMPRDDTPLGAPAVRFALDVPTGGVALRGGPLGAAFDTGIEYLLKYSVDDLLFQFRKRAGLPQPPGAACVGWDCRADWIEGSLAGLFLMGAGGHLRWVEHPQLRSMMDALIDGIEACAEPDGYLAAFTQAKLATDEHPDYTTSWTVHGFLEAHIAGNAKALRMIRAHMNVSPARALDAAARRSTCAINHTRPSPSCLRRFSITILCCRRFCRPTAGTGPGRPLPAHSPRESTTAPATRAKRLQVTPSTSSSRVSFTAREWRSRPPARLPTSRCWRASISSRGGSPPSPLATSLSSVINFTMLTITN